MRFFLMPPSCLYIVHPTRWKVYSSVSSSLLQKHPISQEHKYFMHLLPVSCECRFLSSRAHTLVRGCQQPAATAHLLFQVKRFMTWELLVAGTYSAPVTWGETTLQQHSVTMDSREAAVQDWRRVRKPWWRCQRWLLIVWCVFVWSIKYSVL